MKPDRKMETKFKRGYICLTPLQINSPFPVNYPKGMVHILGVFTSKREALKFGTKVQEVKYSITTSV